MLDRSVKRRTSPFDPTVLGGPVSERHPTTIGITIDCPDADAAAAFWERFSGYRRRPHAADSAYVTIDRPDDADAPDGPPHLTFQTVPEPKVDKARLHLDLFVDHAGPLVSDMVDAGATVLSRTEAGEWTTRVLQDPAGNELCVIGPD
jgi:hypothetical protein